MSTCRPHALFYVPSKGGNYFLGVAYTLMGLAFVARYVKTKKDVRPHSTILLMLGCLTYAIGCFMRPSMDRCALDMNLYLAQLSVIGAAPAFFLAFNWHFISTILRRTTTATTATSLASLFSGLGFFFALVIFALFLASGPAYLSQSASAHLTPRLIMKSGAAIQLGYYILYLVAVFGVHFMLVRSKTVAGVHAAFGALYVSSLLMMMRVAFRFREKDKMERKISRNETWQLTLDALPMFLSVAVWLALYPTMLLAKIEKSSTHGQQQSGAYPAGKLSNEDRRSNEDIEKRSTSS